MLVSNTFMIETSMTVKALEDKRISDIMLKGRKNLSSEDKEYKNKKGFKTNESLLLERVKLTVYDLYSRVIKGYGICHLFITNIPGNDGSEKGYKPRTDGKFATWQKKDHYFEGSYWIGVDIDQTDYNDVTEFVAKLSLQPTFYYTTYSNKKWVDEEDENGNPVLNADGTPKQAQNCARFRLIYVFNNKIDGDYLRFKYYAWLLNNMIKKETQENIKDNCNLVSSQYFNGTNKDKADQEHFKSKFNGCIYDFSDLGASEEGYLDFLLDGASYGRNKEGQKKQVKSEKRDDIIFTLKKLTGEDYEYVKYLKGFRRIASAPAVSGEFDPDYFLQMLERQVREANGLSEIGMWALDDWMRLGQDPEEFRHSYPWVQLQHMYKNVIWRSDVDFQGNDWAFAPADYGCLFYPNDVLKDGQRRRWTLFQRMCLKRILKPTVSKDELLYNAFREILSGKIYDDVKIFTKDEILKRLDDSFEYDLELFKEEHPKTMKKLLKPEVKVVYKSIKVRTAETRGQMLASMWDLTKNFEENVTIFYDLTGIKYSDYYTVNKLLVNNGIKLDPTKLSDQEVYDFTDINLSGNKNYKYITGSTENGGLGYKLDKNRFFKIFNLKKEGKSLPTEEKEQVEEIVEEVTYQESMTEENYLEDVYTSTDEINETTGYGFNNIKPINCTQTERKTLDPVLKSLEDFNGDFNAWCVAHGGSSFLKN